ncbi:hypothetical protein L873DRAFT_1814720, partial [Choiromyces venosus 120613-1]
MFVVCLPVCLPVYLNGKILYRRGLHFPSEGEYQTSSTTPLSAPNQHYLSHYPAIDWIFANIFADYACRLSILCNIFGDM